VLAQQGQDALVLLSLDDGSYFSLNEVGAHVWNLCDGTRTLAQVVEGVCTEFDATPDEVTPDVLSLVDDLASEKLLVDG
jgi:hypothetical protein